MPNTIAKIARDYPTSLTAKLVSAGGTGTPNPSGYACSASAGMQTITIAEALVGLFYIYLYDASNEIAWQGYIDLLDDTNTYYAFYDLAVLVQAKNAATQTTAAALRSAVGLTLANLGMLVNFCIGKKVVTDNGNGTFDYAIRNDADNANLAVVRHNPSTGASERIS